MLEYLPHIATVLVALIGALAAVATQRSASKTNRSTEVETRRVDREKEAYERARAFDVATIDRQSVLIDELNEDNDALRETVRLLRAQLESHESGDDSEAHEAARYVSGE